MVANSIGVVFWYRLYTEQQQFMFLYKKISKPLSAGVCSVFTLYFERWTSPISELV